VSIQILGETKNREQGTKKRGGKNPKGNRSIIGLEQSSQAEGGPGGELSQERGTKNSNPIGESGWKNQCDSHPHRSKRGKRKGAQKKRGGVKERTQTANTRVDNVRIHLIKP